MIHLLCPTIRPNVLRTTVQDWLQKAVNSSQIKVVPIVNNKEDADLINEYSSIVANTTERGVTKALYFATKDYEADNKDIIIVVSDDFFPPQDWDQILQEEFVNFDGVITFFDGIHDEGSLVTLPILTFSALKKMNKIIYHPSYKHLWSDVECFRNASDLGILRDLRKVKQHILFEHRHHYNGRRAFDQSDSYVSGFERADHENYDRRAQLSLEERLKE